MEPVRQKIDLETEVVSHIQVYLMNLLNSQDIIYDADGEVVNEVSSSPYCKTLRFISERRDLCQCYSRELSKSAIYYKKQFEDMCPGGLTILSAPVFLAESAVVGAHCVVVSNTPRSKFSIYDIAEKFHIDAHILWDAVKKTPLIPKPILKVAREQVLSSTELMSKVITRIHTVKQNESAMAIKYHAIEEIFKTKNISK